MPYRPAGDAAGQIATGPGGWDRDLEAAMTERVLDVLAQHVDGLRDTILGVAVLTPVQLEIRNPNLVRGDPYAGSTELDQSYLRRPLPSYGSHRTPVRGLYQCGASTYPGPGLHGASGRIVATTLSRREGRARAGIAGQSRANRLDQGR
jgi:phytoene dehydrogenase-like protein